jgi:hypothetical protein
VELATSEVAESTFTSGGAASVGLATLVAGHAVMDPPIVVSYCQLSPPSLLTYCLWLS